ncbi:hypothetical protein PHYBOEH_000773 [Phytophthora boehmeriae]|uniref:Uncharacterized protein n=1 Tax=Phytophthora boehmeriae TaxID=109152 RepID=A0A8T1X0D9_9STRA|nr:hypothetical protein PHYBOEH_000773 [Phytophthora boehmeriae]
MPTSSSLEEDAAIFIHSNRSRPSSAASRGATSPVTNPIGEKQVSIESSGPSTKKLVTVILADRSTYHGEVDPDGIPDGVGVLLSVFGSRYAGTMKEGKKHGAGVVLHTNGTSYSGEFENDVPCGYGVYVGMLGDKYVGQWEDGSRHGIGVGVDPDAIMTAGRFDMDDLVLTHNPDEGETALQLSWGEEIQPHVLDTIIAERTAIHNQNDARQRHTDAIIQGMTAIGLKSHDTPESIDAFEADQELELEKYLQDQNAKMHDANAAAGEMKNAEAQMIQRQKEMRIQITARRQELAQLAKYVAMAEARAAQVREAERTLSALQRQLDTRSSST